MNLEILPFHFIENFILLNGNGQKKGQRSDEPDSDNQSNFIYIGNKSDSEGKIY